MLAAILFEAVRDQLDVGAELFDFLVGKYLVVEGRLQALLDQPQ